MDHDSNIKKFKLIFIFWSGIKSHQIPSVVLHLEKDILKNPQFEYRLTDLNLYEPIIGESEKYEDWLIDYYLYHDPENTGSESEGENSRRKRRSLLKNTRDELKNRTGFGTKMINKALKIEASGKKFYAAIYHCTTKQPFDEEKFKKFKLTIKNFKNYCRSKYLNMSWKWHEHVDEEAMDWEEYYKKAPSDHGTITERANIAHNIIHCYVFNSSQPTFEDSLEHQIFEKNLNFLKKRCVVKKCKTIDGFLNEKK